MPTLFCLATAEAHGLPMEDLDRRRTLVLAVLLGNSGSGFVQKAAGRTGPYWARTLVKAMPLSAINTANRVLGPRFITKWGTQAGHPRSQPRPAIRDRCGHRRWWQRRPPHDRKERQEGLRASTSEPPRSARCTRARARACLGDR